MYVCEHERAGAYSAAKQGTCSLDGVDRVARNLWRVRYSQGDRSRCGVMNLDEWTMEAGPSLLGAYSSIRVKGFAQIPRRYCGT